MKNPLRHICKVVMMPCCHCCLVAQSCPTLCDPMDCSPPGFPVLHHLLELAQTQVYRVSDAIQPHPLSSPSPPAFNLAQHQDLFQWVGSSHQVADAKASASALPMNIQDWFPLGLTGLISLQSGRLSRVFSKTTVRNKNYTASVFLFVFCLLFQNQSNCQVGLSSWMFHKLFRFFVSKTELQMH